METPNNRRKLPREATDAKIKVEWSSADGVRHTVAGNARDGSADGLSGVFPDPAPKGQLVLVRFTELGILGLGVVRHSTPVDHDYLVGIALIGDLQSS